MYYCIFQGSRFIGLRVEGSSVNRFQGLGHRFRKVFFDNVTPSIQILVVEARMLSP